MSILNYKINVAVKIRHIMRYKIVSEIFVKTNLLLNFDQFDLDDLTRLAAIAALDFKSPLLLDKFDDLAIDEEVERVPFSCDALEPAETIPFPLDTTDLFLIDLKLAALKLLLGIGDLDISVIDSFGVIIESNSLPLLRLDVDVLDDV